MLLMVICLVNRYRAYRFPRGGWDTSGKSAWRPREVCRWHLLSHRDHHARASTLGYRSLFWNLLCIEFVINTFVALHLNFNLCLELFTLICIFTSLNKKFSRCTLVNRSNVFNSPRTSILGGGWGMSNDCLVIQNHI